MKKKESQNKKLIPIENFKKYYSYKEAWDRITSSIEKEFYLEAVTIEESIISDRILSYFKKTKNEKLIKKLDKDSFYNLIEAFKKDFPEPIKIKEIDNLQERLDNWRKSRNKIIHNIVRDKIYQEDFTIRDFINEAKECSQEGLILAKYITTMISQKNKLILKENTT
jgi:hypothetical protein